MPTLLTTHADEKSTYVVTAAFTDEDGNAVTPNTLTWALTDSDGTVINDRDDESISPDTSVDIVLSGDDLQIVDSSDDGVRILTVEGTYNSDAGSGLPLKESCKFIVDNLVAVT